MAYFDSENGSYYLPGNVQSPEYLIYASRNGSKWILQIVDNWNFPNVNPQGSIGYNSLALDSKNDPYIAYIVTDGNSHLLKCAHMTEVNWSIQTVDYAINGGSIALDSAGNPHIAYSGANGELKYASWTGSTWKIQTVDFTAANYDQYLALDSKDRPSIIYGLSSNLGNSSVNWATETSTGTGWNIQTVVSTPYIFWFGNVVVDSHGYPHFTRFYQNDGDSGFIYYD